MREWWQGVKACRGRLVATVFFLLFIFVWGVRNALAFLPEAGQLRREGAGLNRETFAFAEEIYNEEFAGKAAFVEVHGAAQKTMAKNEVGNFDAVRFLDGQLLQGYDGTPVLLPREHYPAEEWGGIAAFSEFCQSQGTPFLYVQVPNVVIEGYSRLPRGMTDHRNQSADEKLGTFRSLGVEVLDLREEARADGLDPATMFFKTDHHWTVETAFWAHTALLRHFEEAYGLEFEDSAKVTDLANYHRDVYPASFLGSVGRRTGQAYSGIDDFTVIRPAFDTRFTYINDTQMKAPRSGPFEESLLNLELFDGNPAYLGQQFNTYLHGLTPEYHIINDAGGRHRILLIQDSYGQPVASFLALSFAGVDIVDPRYYEGLDLAAYIEENGPYDVVVCLDQVGMAGFFQSME